MEGPLFDWAPGSRPWRTASIIAGVTSVWGPIIVWWSTPMRSASTAIALGSLIGLSFVSWLLYRQYEFVLADKTGSSSDHIDKRLISAMLIGKATVWLSIAQALTLFAGINLKYGSPGWRWGALAPAAFAWLLAYDETLILVTRRTYTVLLAASLLSMVWPIHAMVGMWLVISWSVLLLSHPVVAHVLSVVGIADVMKRIRARPRRITAPPDPAQRVDDATAPPPPA